MKLLKFKSISEVLSMGLFTKYCEICGKKIEKGNDTVRNGKHFDNGEHADEYVKMVESRRQNAADESTGGGCCC